MVPAEFAKLSRLPGTHDFVSQAKLIHVRLVAHPKNIRSEQVRPRQGTQICNFGVPSPLEALHWIFCIFSSIYVQFSKTSPLKSGESSEKSSGENRVKSRHVCGCHGFFGPDKGKPLPPKEKRPPLPRGSRRTCKLRFLVAFSSLICLTR